MSSLEPHVIKKIADEEALFFLGAGYAAAYGQITTSSICAKIREAIVEESTHHTEDKRRYAIDRIATFGDADLAGLAELFDYYHGPDAAKQFVASLLQTVNVDLAPLGVLAELPLSTIVTTNFDELIENAFNRRLDVCFQDEHVRPQTTRRTRLIKMHGSVADYTSLVLNRADYDNFKGTHPKIYQIIKARLLEKVPIVIGYGMEDSNFRDLVKDLRAENWVTEIIVVQREPDPLSVMHWGRHGVSFVSADAKEFLESLSESIREYRKSCRVNPAFSFEGGTPSVASEGDHNPFKFFQTDKIGYSSVDIIRRYFVKVPEYAKIVSPASNTIVAGSRGSGKTMLLRYLSIEVQLGRTDESENLPFIGFYVKCGAKLFSSMSCRGDGTCLNRQWVDFFAHVFNLAIVLRLCQILELLRSLKVLDFPKNGEAAFCRQLIEDQIRCHWRRGFKKPTFRNAEKAIEDAFNTARSGPPEQLKYLLPLDFLQQVSGLLKELHSLFNGRPFFFLLDEMENLTDAQWEVVNLLLKDRDDPITFKVAAASEGRPTRDANGRILKYEDDYTLVSTDKYSKDQNRDYLAFLRKVADRCLVQSECGISSVEELLEKREYRSPSERLRFVAREFSGFQRYAYLSSGVVRTFVSLLKDTVSYAEPDVARRNVLLKPISFQQQNAVVQVKSAIHRQNYLEAEHPDDVLALVNALAQVFRLELQNSIESCRNEIESDGGFNYDHLRTISQVQVQHFAKLTDRTRNALTQALEVGLLQRPLDNRQPQQRSQVPHENFKMHKMLCPYYELGLANRFPRKIDAETLNLVFQLSEAEFADRISVGRQKYAKKRHADSRQKSLEMTVEVEEDKETDEVEEYDVDAE
jgi:hypothetical protein